MVPVRVGVVWLDDGVGAAVLVLVSSLLACVDVVRVVRVLGRDRTPGHLIHGCVHTMSHLLLLEHLSHCSLALLFHPCADLIPMSLPCGSRIVFTAGAASWCVLVPLFACCCMMELFAVLAW